MKEVEMEYLRKIRVNLTSGKTALYPEKWFLEDAIIRNWDITKNTEKEQKSEKEKK